MFQFIAALNFDLKSSLEKCAVEEETTIDEFPAVSIFIYLKYSN